MIPSTRRRVNPSAKARANVVVGRRRSCLRSFSLHESRFRFPTSVSPSSAFSSVSSREISLLFPTVIAEMMLSNTLDDDSLGTSIRHLILDQFVIPSEHSLNALEPHTFYDANCRAGRNDCNDSEIRRKDADLIQQMRSKLLMVETARSLSCQHLSSSESISAR